MPEKGDIIAFYPTSIIDKFVRWAGKTKYSHIGICVSEHYYISARWNGISLLPIPNLKYDLFIVKGIREKDIEKIIDFAMAWLGKEYDFLGLIGCATKLPLNRPGKFFCSELMSILMFLIDRECPLQLSPQEFTELPFLVGV